MNVPNRVVICLLHVNFEQFLLQLRDFKPDIYHPGHWGAFGGKIEENESPKEALVRELTEEIEYVPDQIDFFQVFHRDSLEVYVFYSPLGIPLPHLELREGLEMGLFSKEEILSRHLFSPKRQESYPVVPILAEFIECFLEYKKLPPA